MAARKVTLSFGSFKPKRNGVDLVNRNARHLYAYVNTKRSTIKNIPGQEKCLTKKFGFVTKKLYTTGSSSNEVDDEAINDDSSSHVITDHETIQGSLSKHEFQAETKQLLDIVARSLYSEKEVFIREIVSNASDALEKLRHFQVIGNEVCDADLPLEIHLTTDEENGLFVIQDFGVGLNKEELINNLGTIARSGSKAFINQMSESESSSHQNIIGQFGVGFYSTFMVGNQIDVYTKSYEKDSVGYFWTSDGSGSYEMAEAEGVSRGTKIIIHLKDEDKRFSMKTKVEEIIRRYSNFVGFPIYLNGARLNNLQALWTMSDRDVTEENHKEFYQFISNTSDDPRYSLMYKADAPLDIRSVFYVPSNIPEMFGFGRMELGVSLYSRKVLIQGNAKNILPEWLRFIRGVVDSEDIPLNLSRELLQDSALIAKLREVLVSKILRFFVEQSKKDGEKFAKFMKECGNYFREGIVTTQSSSQREEIAQLLRFETSHERNGKTKSLKEYVSNMKDDQTEIYFLCAPNRALAESSPYYESLKSRDVEVLFTYDENDEVVLAALKEFQKKNIVSAENFLVTCGDDSKDNVDASLDSQDHKLSEKEVTDLMGWIQNTLGKTKVVNIKSSTRAVSHPAMITVPDMGAARRWLKFVKSGPNAELLKIKFDVLQPTLEINPNHDIILALNQLKSTNPLIANLLAEQLFDNALITAGLMDDPREMVGRLNTLLSKVTSRVNIEDSKKKESTIITDVN